MHYDRWRDVNLIVVVQNEPIDAPAPIDETVEAVHIFNDL